MVWSIPIIRRVDPIKMIKLAFLLLWLLAGMSEGSPILDPVRSLVKRGDNIRVCGRMLVDTLNLLCDGEYYDPSEDSASRLGKRNINATPVDPYNEWIALSLHGSSGGQERIGHERIVQERQQPQLQRFQRGVVDECCRKACSPSTLLSYCRS